MQRRSHGTAPCFWWKSLRPWNGLPVAWPGGCPDPPAALPLLVGCNCGPFLLPFSGVASRPAPPRPRSHVAAPLRSCWPAAARRSRCRAKRLPTTPAGRRPAPPRPTRRHHPQQPQPQHCRPRPTPRLGRPRRAACEHPPPDLQRLLAGAVKHFHPPTYPYVASAASAAGRASLVLFVGHPGTPCPCRAAQHDRPQHHRRPVASRSASGHR